MSKEYVERRHDSFYLTGSRVPLAHIVREFQRGASPEAIRSHYSTLTLEEVYGAITFYLVNKEEVENDIIEREREEDAFETSHPFPSELSAKLERARLNMLTRKGRGMIRFLADADLDEGIVAGCLRREPTMDFLSANDAKLRGPGDPEVLRIAASDGRNLVSHDFKTMPRHFGDSLQATGSSPGVFLVKQSSPIGDVIEDLVLIWSATDAEEWKNRILRIPRVDPGIA